MKNLFKFIKKYFFLLGLLLFVIILSRIDLSDLLQKIKNINPFYLLLTILLTMPTLFFKALCWNYIKRKQGINYSLKDSFLMYGAGAYLSIFTPGRLGELGKIVYLKKDGHSIGKGMVSVILDRFSDFVFLLLFVFLGSLFLLSTMQKQILIFAGGGLILILAIIIFLKTGLFQVVFKKLFDIFVPQKHRASWQMNFKNFIDDLKIYKIKHYLVILLITCFSWLFYYLQMYALSKGINLDISFLYLAITVTVAGLITLIPISIYGIGTRDAALIVLFSPFLISKEQIILFSGLILLMYLVNAFIGLICWLIKPIRI